MGNNKKIMRSQTTYKKPMEKTYTKYKKPWKSYRINSICKKTCKSWFKKMQGLALPIGTQPYMEKLTKSTRNPI